MVKVYCIECEYFKLVSEEQGRCSVHAEAHIISGNIPIECINYSITDVE